MPLLQIFNSISRFLSRNAIDQSQPRHASKQDISGSKRHLPEEIVSEEIREEIRRDPTWNISGGESNSYSQQPAKKQRTGSQNLSTNKILASKFSPDLEFRQPLWQKPLHNPTDLMRNHRGVSDSSPLPTDPFDDVVYVRKSLLSPEQLQVAAATERAIRAHETLRSLRSKAISQTVAPSRSAHDPV